MSASLEVEPVATAWLIELRSRDVFKGWWHGTSHDDYSEAWTTDANQAIKFSTKQDADLARIAFKLTLNEEFLKHISTEHMWINGSYQKSITPRKEQKPVGMFQEYEEGRFEQMDESFAGIHLYATPQETMRPAADRVALHEAHTKIIRLEGEAQVLRELLAEAAAVIATLEGQCVTEQAMLDELRFTIDRALQPTPDGGLL